MITSLFINNFKNFTKLEIENLTQFALIGGKNNIGKTNVLESLFILHDRYNPEMVFKISNFRGITEVELDSMSVWGPIFYRYDLTKEIIISVKRNGITEKMVISFNQNNVSGIVPVRNNEIFSSETSHTYTVNITIKIDGKKDQKMHITSAPQRFSYKPDKKQLPVPSAVFMGSRGRVNPNEDANRFGRLDILSKQEEVVKYLKIIEPKIKSISSIAIGNTSLLHGDIGIGRKVPIAYIGDGVSRLLSILLAITSAKNGIVLIDEIENGIHYSVMPNILSIIAKAAKEYNCQIVCTTHSYDLLRASKKAFSESNLKEDFSYIRLEKNKLDNSVFANIFNYEMLSTAIERDWEVR